MLSIPDNHILITATDYAIAQHANTTKADFDLTPRNAHLLIRALRMKELEATGLRAVLTAAAQHIVATHFDAVTPPDICLVGYIDIHRNIIYPGMETYVPISMLQPPGTIMMLLDAPHEPPFKGICHIFNDPTE